MSFFALKRKILRSSAPWTWSAWRWVIHTASIWSTPSRTSWSRSSGGASTKSRPSGKLKRAPCRVLRSLGSSEVHRGQWHPITGTPKEVPVPRKVSIDRVSSKISNSRCQVQGLLSYRHGQGLTAPFNLGVCHYLQVSFG